MHVVVVSGSSVASTDGACRADDPGQWRRDKSAPQAFLFAPARPALTPMCALALPAQFAVPVLRADEQASGAVSEWRSTPRCVCSRSRAQDGKHANLHMHVDVRTCVCACACTCARGPAPRAAPRVPCTCYRRAMLRIAPPRREWRSAPRGKRALMRTCVCTCTCTCARRPAPRAAPRASCTCY